MVIKVIFMCKSLMFILYIVKRTVLKTVFILITTMATSAGN